MKRLIVGLLAIGLAATGFAQNAPANLFITRHMKVNPGKRLEWEKKIVPFLKTHYPQTKYRMWEVLTGPNTGTYHIVVGPMTYKDLDTPTQFPKGLLAMRTEADAFNLILETNVVSHLRRVDVVSMTKSDRKLKYIQVNETLIAPGTWPDIRTQLAKNKEVWVKSGLAVDYDVYRAVSSGVTNRFFFVNFYETYEESDKDLAFPDLYDKAYGNDEYFKANKAFYEKVQTTTSELRVLREDLSSM